MYEECCSNRPDHLRRFPCMSPWLGNRYQDGHYKRLLVMGESHYLPEGSTIHHDPRIWYGSRQEELSDQERDWVDVACNLTIKERERDKKYKAGRIYVEISKVVKKILTENNVSLDEKEFPLDHVAYFNYFQRPARGKSIKPYLDQQDREVAKDVLRWFIECYKPELVVTASRFAGGYARGIVEECNLPFESAPQPISPAWNTPFYEYRDHRVTGKELFHNFLNDH